MHSCSNLQGGAASPDISTPSASDTLTTIRLLYGHSIAKELVHHQLSSSRNQRNDDDMDQDEGEDPESWMAESYFTNANYQAKKMVFLLFINRTCISFQCRGKLCPCHFLDRLVESVRMKRALESVYTGILPKGSSPFVYLRLSSIRPS